MHTVINGGEYCFKENNIILRFEVNFSLNIFYFAAPFELIRNTAELKNRNNLDYRLSLWRRVIY